MWPKSFSKETKVGHIATSKAAEAEIMTVEEAFGMDYGVFLAPAGSKS